jgi:hypothetical protein
MDEHKPVSMPVDVSPVARLSQLTGRIDRAPLLEELRKLAKPQALDNVSVEQRELMTAELRRIVRFDERYDVTGGAIQALVNWAGDAAKPDLIAAAKSTHLTTRQAALPIVAQWKDADSARAIAPMLNRREERNAAVAALKEMGPPAISAVGEVLIGSTDQLTGLAAIGILESIGGPTAIDALNAYGQRGDDLLLREIAKRKAEVLAKK